jgi:hypothetical protein
MYTIDLTITNTAFSVSVQKKEQKDAQAVYQEVVEAMRSGNTKLIELTCDKQEDKKVAVLSDRISAIIVSEKSGASTAGRVPGFFAATEA